MWPSHCASSSIYPACISAEARDFFVGASEHPRDTAFKRPDRRKRGINDTLRERRKSKSETTCA